MTSTSISTPNSDPPPEAAVADILEWMCAGHDGRHVREAVGKLHPEIDAEAALNAAVESLRADGNLDRNLLKGWALRCYREIYRRQLEIGDFDGCRKTLKELVALSEK